MKLHHSTESDIVKAAEEHAVAFRDSVGLLVPQHPDKDIVDRAVVHATECLRMLRVLQKKIKDRGKKGGV